MLLGILPSRIFRTCSRREVGIGDYTVAFKLSNTVNGAALRRWVVAMFESLYQSVYRQSNGMLPVLTATRFGDAFDQVLDLCLGSMPGVAVVSMELASTV